MPVDYIGDAFNFLRRDAWNFVNGKDGRLDSTKRKASTTYGNVRDYVPGMSQTQWASTAVAGAALAYKGAGFKEWLKLAAAYAAPIVLDKVKPDWEMAWARSAATGYGMKNLTPEERAKIDAGLENDKNKIRWSARNTVTYETVETLMADKMPHYDINEMADMAKPIMPMPELAKRLFGHAQADPISLGLMGVNTYLFENDIRAFAKMPRPIIIPAAAVAETLIPFFPSIAAHLTYEYWNLGNDYRSEAA